MRLSATYHPLQYLTKKVLETLPTISSVISVCADKNSLLSVNHNGEKAILSQEDKVRYQNLREVKTQIRWVDVDFFNLENDSLKIGQTNITSEKNNRQLLLSFRSKRDDKGDVLAITFPEQFTLFNRTSDFNTISTSEKALIGEMLFQSLAFDYKRIIEESSFFKQYNTIQASKELEVKKLNNKIDQLEAINQEFINSLILELKTQKEKEYGISINLQPAFTERLSELKLSLETLKNKVLSAIDMAFNFNFGSSSISISSHYLNEELKDDNKQYVEDKMETLLNRYEESANKCLMTGIKVTGKNVAANLLPAVSPPAITDAIKKNYKRISFLLDKYPTKWKLIRNGLKPIQGLDGSEFKQAV